jgi:hypothetical protein
MKKMIMIAAMIGGMLIPAEMVADNREDKAPRVNKRENNEIRISREGRAEENERAEYRPVAVGNKQEKPGYKPDDKPGKPDNKPGYKPDDKPGKPDNKPGFKPDNKPGKPNYKPGYKPKYKPVRPEQVVVIDRPVPPPPPVYEDDDDSFIGAAAAVVGIAALIALIAN